MNEAFRAARDELGIPQGIPYRKLSRDQRQALTTRAKQLLAVQLANELRAQIERGELTPGQPLQSDSYLQETHGVSRGTVREAMAILRDAGLVITVQGRGTFVKGND